MMPRSSKLVLQFHRVERGARLHPPASGVTGRRFLAVHWDPRLPPEEAAAKAGAAVAWTDIATMPIEPPREISNAPDAPRQSTLRRKIEIPDTPTFGRYAEIPYDQMTPEQRVAHLVGSETSEPRTCRRIRRQAEPPRNGVGCS
jgi:hypothetical protein